MKACLQASKLILLKRNIQLTIWQTEWEASIWNFAIVFSTPENLLVEISGAQKNTRKPRSKLKHVFLRKCSGVSQKLWMLVFSNLCYCVQHPWEFTSRNYWSSRNDMKATFSAKTCVLRKWCGGISETGDCWCFQTFAIVFSTPEKLLIGISRALGTRGKPLSHANTCVLRKCMWGISETGDC